ncbi:MAG: hypothetical protein R2824_30855 [Saprospiraceae bacterium]|nr:hypothetical protein [Lewinella sp.]
MFLINLLIALLPVFGWSQPAELPADQEEYCNERFNFCMTYPEDYFTESIFSDNGDGVTLRAQNGRIEVSALGAYNVMSWTPEDLINSYFKVMKEKPMEVELLELYSDSFTGWVKMQYNHEIQAFHVYMHPEDNSYTTTIFTVPASSPELLEQLTNSVQVSFTQPSVAINK